MKLSIRWQPLLLCSVAVIGLILRLYGLNWDQGNSFHPDEREILFHVMQLSWPQSWGQFLDPAKSPLNPHFFAYGSFPLYLLAWIGHLLGYQMADIHTLPNLTLVGRVISAVFDSGTVLLTGYLTLLLLQKRKHPEVVGPWLTALLASILLAFTPLHLQLAHFYAVDVILVFFVMLTLVACVGFVETTKPIRWALLCGIAYGLAIATKFSAAPLALPLILAFFLRWHRQRDLLEALFLLVLAFTFAALFFIVTQPYAILDRQNFIQQVSEQGSLVRGDWDLPYVRQFAGTLPYVYQLQNLVLWGMGVTLGVTALLGCIWLLWRSLVQRELSSWLIVPSWVLLYGAITCSFYVKFMRYMLPIYPALIVIAAVFLVAIMSRFQHYAQAHEGFWRRGAFLCQVVLVVLVIGGTVFQGLALLNVYSSPNTRIMASQWIYSHLARGSVLTYEQWDDPLPVSLAGYDANTFIQATYTDASGQTATGLDLYGDDTLQKARQLAKLLPTVDAITMATDRLDKSIPRLPGRYPLTIRYYQLLYSGELGFRLAAQFENHPHLLGITLDDSNADESYSVFDHPTSRIFVRDYPYPYTSDQLLHKLIAGLRLPDR